MSKAERVVPNFDNFSTGFILDEIFRTRDEMAALKFKEGLYKNALEARVKDSQIASETREFGDVIKGEEYQGFYKFVKQERIDSEAVREYLKNDPEGLKFVTKVTTFSQLTRSK